jgi:hypothetical protein
VHLPAGQEIVEYVAGMGDSRKAAEDDSKVNFVLSTFHVLYRSFMNTADPHQTEEPLQINGANRTLVSGDIFLRSTSTNDAPDLQELPAKIREAIATIPLSTAPHWIKIVYAQIDARPSTVAVTLDNADHPALTRAIRDLPWPRQPGFYMAKQFIVVK